MDSKQFESWMNERLSEIQTKVDAGEYSAENLKRDGEDFERRLAERTDGSTVRVTEYENGGLGISTTNSAGLEAQPGAGNEIIVKEEQ